VGVRAVRWVRRLRAVPWVGLADCLLLEDAGGQLPWAESPGLPGLDGIGEGGGRIGGYGGDQSADAWGEPVALVAFNLAEDSVQVASVIHL
jgi:hypothetical protein